MKKFKKALPLLTALLVMLTLLAGCGGAKQTTQSTATGIPEKDKDYVVNLGYYNCDHMTAACIAKDAGIFDELGLKVNVTGNGKVPEAMAAGKMDVGYIGTEGLIRAHQKGSPIFVAANNHLGGSFYLVASNEIKDAKGLVGKKVAIGDVTDSYWIRMANDLGIPYDEKSYQNFDMADKDEFLAVKTGQLDGYLCCDPWGSMAEYDKSGHIVKAVGKLPTGDWGSCCVYSMNRNFAKDHPELASRMLLAHSKAIEYVYTHPVRSSEIFAANYYVPQEVALMTIYKKTVDEGRTLTWKVNNKNFQDEVDYILSLKTMETAPSLDQFIDAALLSGCGADDFDKFIKEKVDPVFPQGMTYEDWKKKAFELEGKKPA